jgi:hypothetical protein
MVAQTGRLLFRRLETCMAPFTLDAVQPLKLAGCQSAKQQIASLCYECLIVGRCSEDSVSSLSVSKRSKT